MQTSHQPRTRRSTPTAQRPSALYSPAAVRLIEQIQAEARAALLEELSAKDGITVLHDFDAASKRVRFDGDNLLIQDARGAEVDLDRRRVEPESWRAAPHMAGFWHPSYWSGHQLLVAGNGTFWRRDLGRMVCDDFGNLVEVPQ